MFRPRLDVIIRDLSNTVEKLDSFVDRQHDEIAGHNVVIAEQVNLAETKQIEAERANRIRIKLSELLT